MIKRYTTSLLGAFTITFTLFLGMSFLIANENRATPKTNPIKPIVMGSVKDPTTPIKKIKKPSKPIKQKIRKTKPLKTTQKGINPNITGKNHSISPPHVEKSKPAFGLANGDIQPLRKMVPSYPRALASRGVEGYVVVKFTVTKMGTVENVEIVESTHSAFNRNSIRAIEKYKYKPRVTDGIAVSVHGVMEKITFELEEG